MHVIYRRIFTVPAAAALVAVLVTVLVLVSVLVAVLMSVLVAVPEKKNQALIRSVDNHR
jgi:uncharacterized membrane protein YqiK